jgi:hypothetical protein
LTPETPEYLKPSRLFDEWKDCVCRARIQRGLTVQNKPAYFEEVPDPETGELVVVNHWVTCRTPEAARELYGGGHDGTRQGKCPRCGSAAIVFALGGATCSPCGWSSVPEAPPGRGGYRRRHYGRRVRA